MTLTSVVICSFITRRRQVDAKRWRSSSLPPQPMTIASITSRRSGSSSLPRTVHMVDGAARRPQRCAIFRKDGLPAHIRVIKVLLHLQHAFEMLLKAALV